MRIGYCLCLVFVCFLDCGIAKPNDYRASDIKYFIYDKEEVCNIFEFNIDDPDLRGLDRCFKPHLPTVVLVHGWRGDYSSEFNTQVRLAISSTTDANIFVVDWGKLAKGYLRYFRARDAIPFVGRSAGQMLQTLSSRYGYSPQKIILVGFSLGAHVVGHIGREFIRPKIGTIIALDPAGAAISIFDVNLILNPNDAEYVQVIHTNALMFGMEDAVGHADFYPNGGSLQPECGILPSCSHNKAWKYFVESITYNNFISIQCNSLDHFNSGTCGGQLRHMGGLFNIDKSVRGKFYLFTNPTPPYGRGNEFYTKDMHFLGKALNVIRTFLHFFTVRNYQLK